MHEFKFIDGQLYCESLKIEDIAKKIDTPFYLYSRKTILDHFYKIKKAFSPIKPLICYSVKANPNLSILKLLKNAGCGFDIISGGELYRLQRIGANPKKIVYAGVGKTEKEIRQAIKCGILLFNIESESELDLINRICKNLNVKQSVSLRLNPGVDTKTHQYISTGKIINKFGLDLEQAKQIFLKKRTCDNINIVGIHIHIGSQIIESWPFIVAINKIISLIKYLRSKRIKLKYFNIGGGLGIVYKKEKPQTAQEFADKVIPLLKKLNLKIIIEPGRFIVGNSGILVTKVLYIKDTKVKRFIIVDAGMNDLIRPALYQAYHEIVPIRVKSREKKRVESRRVDVVGPVCESADFLGKNRRLVNVKEGDYLAVMGAGAYGFTMSSNYNSRPRVCEVMVQNKRFFIIREKETYKDLISHEPNLK